MEAGCNPHGYGHGWPPPLRGDSGRDLWGVPGLNPKDRERVASGNQQAKWTIALVQHCLTHNVAVTIENPRDSCRTCNGLPNKVSVQKLTFANMEHRGAKPPSFCPLTVISLPYPICADQSKGCVHVLASRMSL